MFLTALLLSLSAFAAESEPDPLYDVSCDDHEKACKYTVGTFKKRCDALPAAAEAALEQATSIDHTCQLMDYAAPVCFPCDGQAFGGTCQVMCESEDGDVSVFSSNQDLLRHLSSILFPSDDPSDPPGEWIHTDYTYGVSASCPNVSDPCGTEGDVCYVPLGGAGAVAQVYTCIFP